MTTLNSQQPPLPLLRTKLFPPRTDGALLLPRRALIDRLFAARQQRALILSAPAGFGKSTILSLFRQRLVESGARVAWMSCDEGDSEPQRLVQYLVASIRSVEAEFGANT